MTICTDAFQKMAELERKALGYPALPVAIIPHPLLGRSADELELIVDAMMPMLAQSFRGPAVDHDR